MYACESPAPGHSTRLTCFAKQSSPSKSSTPERAQVTKEEYARVGSKQLGQQLEEQLRQQGKKPCVIPVGGSDAIGTFGYLAATQEISEQAGQGAFTDIVNVSHNGFVFGHVHSKIHSLTLAGLPLQHPLDRLSCWPSDQKPQPQLYTNECLRPLGCNFSHDTRSASTLYLQPAICWRERLAGPWPTGL